MVSLAQGLGKHTSPDALHIRICHIPAGSGNGVAATCALWTPVTAAHAMIHGQVVNMDAATVVQPKSGTRLLSVLCIQCALQKSICFACRVNSYIVFVMFAEPASQLSSRCGVAQFVPAL